jgi:putative transposase
VLVKVFNKAKEDLIWPNDFQTPMELEAALDKWIVNYNTDYPHSTLGYKTPCEFEKLHLEKFSNFMVA